MRLKKLVFRCLLCSFLLISTGCQTQPLPSSERDLPSPKDLEGSPEGYSYTIVCDTGADDTLCPKAGTVLGDRLLEHYRSVEKKFSCTVTTTEMTDGKIVNRITAGSAAGNKFSDLVQTDAYTVLCLYRAGYLTALEDIPVIDPSSEKWGLPSQQALLTENGKRYGFFGLWLGASFPSVSGVLLCNLDMLNEYALPNPMEYWEAGEWKWSNFRYLAKEVTCETGDDSSTYAFACPNELYPDFIHAAICSNGGNRIIKDGEGSAVCGYNDYSTIDALSWVKGLVTEDKVAYPLNMHFDNGYLDVLAFTNLRTAFLVTDGYNGVRTESDYPLYTFEEGFEWLPFPYGTSASSDTCPSYFDENDTFYAVAGSEPQSIADSAPILDALFDAPEGLTPDSWKEELENNYFFDSKSCSIYLKLLQGASDRGAMIDPKLNDSIDTVFAEVVNGRESAVKAVIEAESVVNSFLK